MAQASIDLHKQHLPPVDRARLFESIIAEKGFTGKEAAELLGISPSLLSRYLCLTKLAPDLQQLVNSGQMEWTKGSLIAQATLDHDQQREMAKTAAGMSRDKLAATVRKQRSGNGEASGVRVNRLKVPLPGGTVVTLAGNDLSLSDVIEVLTETLKAARKANEESLDGKTWVRVMADKAKAGA